GKRLPSSATSAFASGDDLLALSDLSAVFSGRRGSSAGALSRASLALLWRSRWYTCEKLEASADAGSLVLAGRAGVDREGTSTAEVRSRSGRTDMPVAPMKRVSYRQVTAIRGPAMTYGSVAARRASAGERWPARVRPPRRA